MKLSRLLQIDAEVKPAHSLSNNFGDARLCLQNKIFSNIRKVCLRNLFSFSPKPNTAYLALPLSQLENILRSKVIPYIDNVLVLQELEQSWPQATDWDDVTDHLRRNFLFHESCHAVARSESLTMDYSSTEDQVLQMLIEESYANTCELLAVIDANDTAHQIFYEVNSYTSLFAEKAHLKIISEEFQDQRIFVFILLSYLFSNFLRDGLTESELSRILIICEIPVGPSKKLRRIAKICFTLDERFKNVTTRFYMRIHGLKTSQSNLLQFDFLSKIEKSPLLRTYIKKLAEIALGEFKPT